MNREILGYKCRKCGHVHYPNRYRCRKCGHTEFEAGSIAFDPVPLPRTGKLLTFTDVYALPPDFEAVSLRLGMVELDGGQRMTGQLDIPEPRTGMRVRGSVEVVRRDEYQTHFGMVFRGE
jgi:uncharacterized OB-fold protein